MVARFALRSSGDQYSFSPKAAGNSEIVVAGERDAAKPSALKGLDAIERTASVYERRERRVSTGGQTYFVLRRRQ